MQVPELAQKEKEPEEDSVEEEAAVAEAAEVVPQVVAEEVPDKTTRIGLP